MKLSVIMRDGQKWKPWAIDVDGEFLVLHFIFGFTERVPRADVLCWGACKAA